MPEQAPDAPPPGVRIAPGLTLSGYATAQLLAPDGADGPPSAAGTVPSEDGSQFARRPRLALTHVSGIAWWEPAAAWKALVEVDLEDLVQLPAHDSLEDGPTSSPYVALDRLYVDYRATDAIGLRVGKFLTPIGRWNQEHSDPQTWTVLRPLISQSAFPTTATGIMAFGSVPFASRWIDYQLWESDGDDWRPDPRSVPFGRALGLRVATNLDPRLELGVSASRFTESHEGGVTYGLVGMDGLWRARGWEISGEALTRYTLGSAPGAEHGGFLQAAAPVTGRWWLVGRVETYRRAADPHATNTGLLGVVYRSGAHWVFKAEWAQASPRSQGLPGGLLASLTLVY